MTTAKAQDFSAHYWLCRNQGTYPITETVSLSDKINVRGKEGRK